MATPEGVLQNKICEYLQKQGYFFARLNNQPTYDQHLNKGYGGYRGQGKWAQLGLADILVLVGGHAHFLEVKTEKGRQSADQKLFERRCKQNGTDYSVVRTVADVQALGL